MPFDAGRVTFTRFRTEGKPPIAADQALLDQLHEHRFTESPIGAPDEVEAGWITGEHLFDTQFTYEKNCFGDILLFAMRLDTNKVPAEVKRAYKLINEQAAASGNPSGFASKNQRREAADLAARQAHEDLASGRYRRSKMVPVMWDLRRGIVYCGATGNTPHEQLHSLFRSTFQLDLSAITSGAIAGDMLRERGLSREHEDLRPSPFTPPPPQARQDQSEISPSAGHDIPHTPWTTSSLDVKDFLGNEFAIWLWWIMEEDEGLVELSTPAGQTTLALAIIKTLDMQCAWDATGRQSLRADAPTRLPEAGEALREGKWPRKIGMLMAESEGGDGTSYEFTLQADQFIPSAIQLPPIEDVESPRELIEHRLRLIRHFADLLDGLYGSFVKLRTGPQWTVTRQKIGRWITARRKPRSVTSPQGDVIATIA